MVNIVPGYGKEAGEALYKHKEIDKVGFTRSTATGLHIIRHAHEHSLKRVTLELGGKSPLIIMDDADLELAIHTS